VLSSQHLNTLFESNRKTPVSDHLRDLLDELLRGELRLSSDAFDATFDEWEYLVGVVTHAEHGRGPVGRFVWRRSYLGDGGTPDAALRDAMPRLLDAGLFGGDPAKATSAKDDYDAMVASSGLRF
jgi:hypothetical protein